MSDDDKHDPTDMPLPIVEKTAEEVAAAVPDIADATPDTPLGAACLWWQGLDDPKHYKNALDQLSLNPSAWDGYGEASGLISKLSIMTHVEDNPDRDDIKYVRFIDYAGDEGGQAFEDAPMYEYFVVTVVKPEGSDWWQVWGLSQNSFPSTADVIGE